MKTKEKIAIGLLLAMVVTNPLSGQYVLQVVDWAFQQMFRYGSWVGIVGSVYLMGLLAFNGYKSSKVKIPAKTKKTIKNAMQYEDI